jgi:TonB family protein
MALSAELVWSLAWKSTLILAGGAVLAYALGRASAAVRHLAWAGTLAALLLLPLASGILPRWQPPAAARFAAVTAQVPMVLNVVASRPGFGISWAALAWLIWAAGVAVTLTYTAAGAFRIRRIMHDAEPLDGFSGGVVSTGRMAVPAVCGFWRPRVVLPKDALSWPAERRRMVLMHERMHISRHDTRTHLLAQLVCALYWPNPLVWWAAAGLRREAEQACDDGVLAEGASAAAYAGQLVEFVAGLRAAGRIPEGGLAMIRISELERRLKAMLKPGSNRRKATPLLVVGTCALSLMALLPLAALRAPAQQAGGGGITGVVIDASGATVPKARVTVMWRSSDRREFVLSGPAGQFTLQPVPEGNYTVTVAKPGFALLRLEGIVIRPGELVTVKTVLNLGQVRETMEIRGERPLGAAQPPMPGASGPQRIPVGGSVQVSKLVRMARPAYPPDCKAEGVEGTVLLRAVIGTSGNVLNLQPINELVDKRLVEAATQAVNQWVYQPTLLNGDPVEIVTEIEVNFVLAQ